MRRQRMELRRIAVAGLIPPGNIERIVTDLQRVAFQQHGLASAEALPVFVPVCSLPPGCDPKQFERALAGARPAFPAALAEVCAVGRAVLLRLAVGEEARGALALVRSALAAAFPLEPDAPPQPPFPMEIAFWLGEAESAAQARAVAGELAQAAIPQAGFARFTYGLLEIQISAGEPWWSEVRWALMAAVRARVAARPSIR